MTLLLATLATRMRPCWMILWPWAWTLGTDALGASRSGGGPEPLCCCCWRRLAICWAVIVMGCREGAHGRGEKNEVKVASVEGGENEV